MDNYAVFSLEPRGFQFATDATEDLTNSVMLEGFSSCLSSPIFRSSLSFCYILWMEVLCSGPIVFLSSYSEGLY